METDKPNDKNKNLQQKYHLAILQTANPNIIHGYAWMNISWRKRQGNKREKILSLISIFDTNTKRQKVKRKICELYGSIFGQEKENP